jgi:hypothetical protein
MLKSIRKMTLLTATLVVVTSGAAIAGGGDEVIKTPDAPGTDIIIKDPGNSAGGGHTSGGGTAPNSGSGSAGPGGGTPTSGNGAPDGNTFDGLLNGLCLGDGLGADELALCDDADPETDVVNAAQVAQKLRDRLPFPRPQLNTSPAAPVKAIVGLETWLWVPPAQWAPLTRSASLGGTTVTVTATPTLATWDMGEATKTCAGPGRVWTRGLGQKASTPCGYTYRHTSVKQPDKKFNVAVSLRYQVTWTCTGQCSAPAGALDPIDGLTDASQLEVSERQSVVTRR